MPANLNLQSMKIFMAVLELRSVGAAARSLAMSQSGLSSALAKLRQDLGDALFVSTASGMHPTTRAKELAAPMREAIQVIEQRILSKGRFDPATDEREFRLSLSDTAEAMYMPRALNAVTRVAPRVRLRSVSIPQPQLLRALSEGQVDLALGYFPDLKTSEFVRRKIGQHGFVVICSSANRQLVRDFSLKRFCEARHVVVEAPTRTQGLLEVYLQKRGIHRDVALTTPHFMSLPEIIAATDLIATVPDAIADAFADLHRLARLELPFRSPVFDSHLHWSKSVNDDPANRWLRGVLVKAFS
ncbi:LysR family transcriptional regulator [Ramlibacter sp. XY19]|uniref:LysR family transcriptional regulator n=1 Tax=Ramlibacter paludis TaxID=2908000 RepID=UPI0023D99A68|nr:LysR family transcriptional regulator [Ramlibacter paludis]MCG2592910.1 LysR family transcriptional regulator [Ramlibacter paludis]